MAIVFSEPAAVRSAAAPWLTADVRGAGLNFDDWRRAQVAAVEAALERWIPADAPAGLGLAMRYSALGGGKRLRALLALAAAHATGGDPAAALRPACAVELIHAYSLVHDDMPCMDNDVLRRGKPTSHVQFGEAMAMLVGDGLQSLAFDVLSSGADLPAATQVRLCRMLSRAAGCLGMAGGQAVDIASTGVMLDETALRDMHRRKTGALLSASVMMGAACGTAQLSAPAALAALERYADVIGIAFQIVDDVLDATQTTETLGKTAGKDQSAAKPTYVSVLGLDAARRETRRLHASAMDALAQSRLEHTQWLVALADAIIERDR